MPYQFASCLGLRSFVLSASLVVALGLVCACATAPVGPPVPAPTLTVGDHWTYRITDNLRRGLVTMLDADVVSTMAGVATVRLVYNNEYGRDELTEEMNAEGGLVVGALKEERVRRFPVPIEMYRFPLQQGLTWRQIVDTVSPETQLPAQILVYATVQGRASNTVPAGPFNTIYIYRIIQLDDEQFWRTRTTRSSRTRRLSGPSPSSASINSLPPRSRSHLVKANRRLPPTASARKATGQP